MTSHATGDSTVQKIIQAHHKENIKALQIAKPSISIRYRSDAKTSDWCLIYVDPMVFVIWVRVTGPVCWKISYIMKESYTTYTE